jgi:hypothetical protein
MKTAEKEFGFDRPHVYPLIGGGDEYSVKKHILNGLAKKLRELGVARFPMHLNEETKEKTYGEKNT